MPLTHLNLAPSNHLECVSNLSIEIQALYSDDVQGALKLISNYYHELQGPEIYSKALDNDTIQINTGWTI
jgi:hypothetical protein